MSEKHFVCEDVYFTGSRLASGVDWVGWYAWFGIPLERGVTWQQMYKGASYSLSGSTGKYNLVDSYSLVDSQAVRRPAYISISEWYVESPVRVLT